MLLRSLILRVSSQSWVERFVKNSFLTRSVVKRFVAGESVQEAMRAANVLAQRGYRVTLDLLGENTKSDADADASLWEYMRILDAIAASPHHGGSAPEKINISIKLTQLGLLLDEQKTIERLKMLSDKAAESGNFIRIDMEDSACTERTLNAASIVFSIHKNIGVVLQSMLHRTERDLNCVLNAGMRVRLVKGAYLESAEVAWQEKADVDQAYVSLGKKLLLEGRFPAFGTHDKRIIASLAAFAKDNGVPPSEYEFQLLYGIRRDVQEELRNKGYGVRIYIPYGTSWYPYFTRRLAERPANLFFFLRSLFGK